VDQHHAVAAAGVVEGKFHPASLAAGPVRSQRLFGQRLFDQDLSQVSRSALMVGASVVGIPCGKPW
jgi:hypothetical protein